jgi:hypothetical protein
VTIALAVTTPFRSTAPSAAGEETTEALAANTPARGQAHSGDGPG